MALRQWRSEAALRSSGPKPAAPKPATGEQYVPRLQKQYRADVVPKLQKEFGIDNVMAVPRLEKIVLNMGVGRGDPEHQDRWTTRVDELAAIAGQRPSITRAKKSIATFKLRAGHADRLQRDAARRPDVRVPRSADLDRAAASPRLPRCADAVLRRTRQLHARHPRSPDLPGDRLRQGRQVEGHEHHDRDDGRRTTSRRCTCCASSACRSRTTEAQREKRWRPRPGLRRLAGL